MENSWTSLTLLCFVLLALISMIIRNKQPKKNSPPGPKPWPIIGNLNLIGSIPHQSFHLLSQRYGGIMQLKFGQLRVVVASSPDIAKLFLRTHDNIFASRPAFAAGKYTAYNYSDMVWSPPGPYWREARKIFMLEVFNPKKLDFFEKIRTEERHNFLSRIHSLSGKPFPLREHILHLTLSTICRMVMGNKYLSKSDNDRSIVKENELPELMDEWLLLNGAFNIGDWIPWLGFLDLQGYVRRMKVVQKKLDTFLNYVIDDHQAKMGSKEDVEPEDLVDTLLRQAEDPDLEVELTRDRIKGLLTNLLVGGTDASATTVEWTIHELLKQPHLIEEAKQELDMVIGRNRWVEENDCSRLPYLDALIMESLRLHPPATLLAPHYATKDCNVAGYDISKGTTVLINAWSIGRDTNSWEKPEEFIPERFIGKEIDMFGGNFALLPFGSGRRKCPGYNLGLKFVRSTLANLLHGFNWKLPEGMKPEDVCVKDLYGFSTRPEVPVSIIMEPTLDIPY